MKTSMKTSKGSVGALYHHPFETSQEIANGSGISLHDSRAIQFSGKQRQLTAEDAEGAQRLYMKFSA